VRGEARRVVSGRAVTGDRHRAQHSTAQHSSHNTAAQAQAHRMNHLSTRFYFACRARTRATPGAEQSRAEHIPFSRVGARGDLLHYSAPAAARRGAHLQGDQNISQMIDLANNAPRQGRA
jgi:hypothetical protein